MQGPNGAGKTTLLRCAGLVPVVEGTAVVLGSDLVADPTTVRRRVGYLGHGSGLYPDLTIAENLRFGRRRPASISAPTMPPSRSSSIGSDLAVG